MHLPSDCADSPAADTPIVMATAQTVNTPPPTVPVVEDQLPSRISLTSPLLDRDGEPVAIDPVNWNHSDMWDSIFSPSVLVSRKELLLLMAERMGLPRNKQGMLRVASCEWHLGRHVTVTTSKGMRLHYWGCGTYGHHTGKKWPTWVEVEGYETSHNSARRTSRLAFVVCGIQLNDICRSLGAPLNADLRELAGDKGKDTVTFLLVRYAKAHASAVRRGPEHRPLCPGPYVNTHSLWTWATRPKGYKRGCFRSRPWSRHGHFFGKTPGDRETVKINDKLAWYDLIQVSNIRCYANVYPDPSEQNMFLQSLVWC